MKTYRLKKWYPSLHKDAKDKENLYAEFSDFIFTYLLKDDTGLTYDSVDKKELECEEYWEEVVEKDYEILSKCLDTTNYQSQPLITSIKRLSDGEVFKIGDLCNPKYHPKSANKIINIKLVNDKYIRISSENYSVCIEDIQHYKECTCTYPKLQKETRECGGCGNYIDKEKHIILTERYRLIDDFNKGRIFYAARGEVISQWGIEKIIKQWENFKDKQDA